MRRYAVPGVVTVVCVALLALLIYGVTQQGEGDKLATALGKGEKPVAIDATLPRLGATGTNSLADYRGKVVVLNFFASWCAPCADEAPLIERTQRLLRKSGATFLGVSWNDTEQDSSAFLRQHGLIYPAIRDITGSYAKAYGVKGMPESFVIDKRGRIVALSRGVMDERFVKSQIEPLLSAPQ
jgi:cytochrome c biogenesis protein CcmG, thiol:disulfide interchange protein DsbE